MPRLDFTTRELLDEARDLIEIAGILYTEGKLYEAATEYDLAQRRLVAVDHPRRAGLCGALTSLIRAEQRLSDDSCFHAADRVAGLVRTKLAELRGAEAV
jgi:hypothetical protein